MIPVRTKVSLMPLLVAVVVLSMLLDPQQAAPAPQPTAAHRRPASTTARADIPPRYLRLYREAGAGSCIPWSALAGVGWAESKHGRVAGSKPGGSSSAGALGPMQFMPGTWATWGRGGNVYDPVDAIPAAARYLCALGAGRDLAWALAAYNAGPGRATHPPASTRRYVADVLAWNHRYAH
jgi:soluble lytic murein transglycosylase-like protein